MWIFGMIDKKEMAELKKAGYEVKKYDEHAFNKFLEPKQKFEEFATIKGMFLAGVWVDGDVTDILVYGTVGWWGSCAGTGRKWGCK